MKQTCFVCQNVDCLSRGSEELMKELTQQVAAKSINAEVKPYICFGGCDFGPNIVVHPQKNWYAGVKKDDLPEIVNSLDGGRAVSRLDTIDASLKEIVYQLLDTGVF
ncbi:MAG: (2Fe-2S) ferredoxin domain-containing protein [Candidatus Binatia bacterium]